ncbi:hypothetical protein [Pedobacter agri]|uniref:hypothetical protein n=1 Tax=Pedobacter agri TaxID=454586 RepID=UPI00292D9560|nr:hypothetical protein [Pedobacter agri]
MARIRSIKPDFFKHEDLAELPAMVRLLFIGLWTQADREGKLENRPKRLKIEIFPYDDFDINEGLDLLEKNGFILRYSAPSQHSESTMQAQCNNSASTFISIISFAKHQQPNSKEARSTIPNPVFTQAPCKHSANTVLASQEGEWKEENGNREREGEWNTEQAPSRDDELEDSILNFFGFTVNQNFDKARAVNEFCFSLKNSGRLDFFRTQFDAYRDFKELSGGFAHGFYKFLGDQKNFFENGAWNAENWSFRLKEEKEKSSAKKENGFSNGQQTARGVEAGLAFASVQRRLKN